MRSDAQTRAIPGVMLRPARPEDLAAVRTLVEAAGLPTGGLEDQFGAQYVVAEAAGEVVAVLGMERYGRHGLLRSAAVHEAWRGRGLGAALARDRLGRAAADRLEAVYLLTTTAAGWFPRFGFERVDRDAVPEELRRAPEFRDICPSSAAVMRLVLSGAADPRPRAAD